MKDKVSALTMNFLAFSFHGTTLLFFQLNYPESNLFHVDLTSVCAGDMGGY